VRKWKTARSCQIATHDRLESGDVGFNPGDTNRRVAEASAGVVKRARGDVENADVRVACAEQMIDEG